MNGRVEHIATCLPVLTSRELAVNVTEIFDANYGWKKFSYIDCGELMSNCTVKSFFEKTNNFDLNTKNASGVTLGEAFCVKFPDVPRAKLILQRFTSCKTIYNHMISTVSTDFCSKQELECVGGIANLMKEGIKENQNADDAAVNHLSETGTIIFLQGILLYYFNQFK